MLSFGGADWCIEKKTSSFSSGSACSAAENSTVMEGGKLQFVETSCGGCFTWEAIFTLKTASAFAVVDGNFSDDVKDHFLTRTN